MNSIYNRRLISEAVRLREMSPRSEWTKILENKENKKTIEESFKRIDEYTKDFHVGDSCVPHRLKRT